MVRASSILALAWLVAAMVNGCVRRAVDLSGRPCKHGGCADGFVCHPQREICAPDVAIDRATVGPGKSCPAVDAFIDCIEGGKNCEHGCFTCEADLTWSECSRGCTDDCQCPAGTVRCDGRHLVACDSLGYIDSVVDCGAPGCSAIGAVHRCNECVPGTIQCVGLDLLTCAADGTVTDRTSCATESRCLGAGVCNEQTGKCQVLPQAPPGTPCDEGGEPAENGSFCDSVCDSSGSCVVGVPACDDANDCTGPDECIAAVGCVYPDLPADTPCGDLCNELCNGTGSCVTGDVVCNDDEGCTDDTCINNTGCVFTPNSLPCDDGEICTVNDTCSGGSCQPGTRQACDDSQTCTIDTCIDGFGCDNTAIDCSSAVGDCHGANACDAAGSGPNCDAIVAPINEGQACTDCASGTCDVCAAGVCLDLDVCTGAPPSTRCHSDLACAATCTATECAAIGCAGRVPEHRACANVLATGWGNGAPCESVLCQTTNDKDSGAGRIGSDCFQGLGSNIAITYVFNTTSPSGTPFHIWMHNIGDTDWDTIAGEYYNCTLTGVTGVPNGFSFTITDDALAGSSRHGNRCSSISTSAWYCWMAGDSDSNATDLTPFGLDAGEHTLTCSIQLSEADEDAGFDGFIFTSDLDFVPDAAADGVCSSGDSSFNAGTCTHNWGPHTTPVPGYCLDGLPINVGANCTTCSGGGSCAVCWDGICRDQGACMGAEPCLTDPECELLQGSCNDPPDDCYDVICSGATYEHQACADTMAGPDWGDGKPCENADCYEQTVADGPTRVGADCYDHGNNGVSIRYTFNTASPTGSFFNIWMRNTVDSDTSEMYTCTLTGVTGTGTLAFSFHRDDLDGQPRHGTGCGNYDNTPNYCWMAADADTDTMTYDPISLDRGEHVLDCTISTSSIDSAAGFDGIIFTTNLGYIPDEADGPAACSDSDELFTSDCSGTTNWGPNFAPAGGLCNTITLADTTPCASGVCCSGVCQSSCP